MPPQYIEPELTIAVLDFQKPYETQLCLESIKQFVKVPHKTILYHNGLVKGNYPTAFLQSGLCDLLMQSYKNNGLGVGTRDLIGAVFSEYFCLLQNDQYLIGNIDDMIFGQIKELLNHPFNNVKSVSVAGDNCPVSQYSERAHFTKTEFYKRMDREIPLMCNGAGPYHASGPWRERQIQDWYAHAGYIHKTDFPILVQDFGCFAPRENADGSVWLHRPDTKQLWLIRAAKGNAFDMSFSGYPNLSPHEWNMFILHLFWLDGKIPEREIADSFTVWNIPEDQVNKYVAALRERYN